MNFVVYYNMQEIKFNEYHDYPILKQSRIHQVQADQYRPNWIKANILREHLEDNIAVFQMQNENIE